MSTPTSPSIAQQPDAQSTAQKLDEINRLLIETSLLNARKAKARAEREAMFYERHPLFARHDWLLPMLIGFAAIVAGAAFAFAIFKLVGH